MTSPLRVLVLYAQPVFWSMGEGCGAAIFTLLPEALTSRGHEVRFCLPAPAGQTAASGTAEEPYCGALLHRFATSSGFVPDPFLPVHRRLWNRVECWRRYQAWAMRTALQVADVHPPDVVVAYGVYEAPAARKVAQRLRVPNITRIFGTSLSLHLNSPLRLCANFPEILAFRTPAHLILLNDDGANGQAVVRRLRVPANRFVHLRNGVDFDRFFPGPKSSALQSDLGVRPGQHLLLTGTRLAPEKQLHRAIALLAGLRERGVDAMLALLGEGPERTRLKALAEAAGVAEWVRFPGAVPQQSMPEWHRTADLFLSLLDRTNAANPVFEAMACGIPVLALDAGSTRAVVRDGETGIVLREEDLAQAPTLVAALLGDQGRCRRMGEAGARSIRTLVHHLPDRLGYEVRLLEAVARRENPMSVPLPPTPGDLGCAREVACR